jgi:hypothetical protein
VAPLLSITLNPFGISFSPDRMSTDSPAGDEKKTTEKKNKKCQRSQSRPLHMFENVLYIWKS